MWRVTRDDVRKELAWKPPAPWSDATAAWKDADTLRVEYTVAGETAAAHAGAPARRGRLGWTR